MSQCTQGPGSGEESAFSILVATDNHLGFMEKDEIRRDDSFAAFEEICKLAQSLQVDFLLLGGDLFHDNKPSRATLVRTIDILRRYCLSDNPVNFQVVSDQTLNFPNSFGHVNYEDEHYNVGMPVFTVHGNHDDPAGVDNLSAVDILSSCNLVNYFGKTGMPADETAQITLHPVLLRKGANRIALYGLGYMRDERLKMIMDNPHGLQWIRPHEPGLSEDDWFNILVVHQNRNVRMTGAKKVVTVDQTKFASFLDLIVWGHEHECLIHPTKPEPAKYYVTQPGSSVVTQLCEGEARPKQVLFLRVQGNQFESHNIALTTPRPFQYAELCLREAEGVNPSDPEALSLFLAAKVHEMIAAAERQYRERCAQHTVEGQAGGAGVAGGSGSGGGRGREGPVPLPLVRIRVDYTGFSTINSQRFGQQFVGKVANPHDMLMFFKAPKKRDTPGAMEVGDERAVQPDELNQSNIEQLLRDSHVRLEVLSLEGLSVALHEFVSKDDKHAFNAFLSASLADTQARLLQGGEGAGLRDDQDILRVVEQRVLQDMEKPYAAALAARADGAADPGEARMDDRGSMDASKLGEPFGDKEGDDDDSGGAGGRGMKQATFDSMGLRGRPPAAPRAAASVGSTAVQEEEEEEIEDDEFGAHGTAVAQGGQDVDGVNEEDEEAMGLGSRASAGWASSQRPSAPAASPKRGRKGSGAGEGCGTGRGRGGAAAAAGGVGRGRGRGRAVGGWSSLGVAGGATHEASVQSNGDDSEAEEAEEKDVRHDDAEEDEEEEEEEEKARRKRARRGVGGVMGTFSSTPSQNRGSRYGRARQ
ncbi:hypothetical protein CLOM_g14710 [Closterium sp. NIES-68]|nr:hypothetical protein CLOM_g14710 [Closterium sp. NIES-68]